MFTIVDRFIDTMTYLFKFRGADPGLMVDKDFLYLMTKE